MSIAPPGLNVRKHDWDIVLAILRAHTPGGFQVCAFGSRVRDGARRGSDLDLAWRGPRPLTVLERVRLVDAFEESMLPYRTDVVDFSELTSEFRTLIENYAIPIWTARAETKAENMDPPA